jgi:hypothetical protein
LYRKPRKVHLRIRILAPKGLELILSFNRFLMIRGVTVALKVDINLPRTTGHAAFKYYAFGVEVFHILNRHANLCKCEAVPPIHFQHAAKNLVHLG